MRKIEGLVVDGEEWLTAVQAAALGGVTKWAVYQAIRSKRLKSRELMGSVAVPASGVRELWPPEPDAEVAGE